MGPWLIEQQNRIKFVMVDSNNLELTGLTLSLEISKDNGVFAASAGTWGETGNGWYWYLSTTGEADTVGPVGVKVTSAGAVQQNLEYTVIQRTSGYVFWPYQVTHAVTTAPIPGVTVWVTTDIAGTRTIWSGITNATGWAKREVSGNFYDPLLPTGNNYFWKYLAGWDDQQGPDLEVVS